MKGFKATNMPLNITLVITYTLRYTGSSIFPNDFVPVISVPL